MDSPKVFNLCINSLIKDARRFLTGGIECWKYAPYLPQEIKEIVNRYQSCAGELVTEETIQTFQAELEKKLKPIDEAS